jgi:hypothetical protein
MPAQPLSSAYPLSSNIGERIELIGHEKAKHLPGVVAPASFTAPFEALPPLAAAPLPAPAESFAPPPALDTRNSWFWKLTVQQKGDFTKPGMVTCMHVASAADAACACALRGDSVLSARNLSLQKQNTELLSRH